MLEKEKITVRFEPRTVRRCDQWIAEANCKSRNEFIEKAVNYYVDRLMAEDADSLPRSISVALDGRLSQMENRLSGLMYKVAVETDMQNGIIADLYRIDDDDLRKRRAESVKNVNRTNGKIRLEDHMRGEDDSEWLD